MSGNRAGAEKEILKYVEAIEGGIVNVGLYKELFKRLSNKEFDNYMREVRDGEAYITMIVPNGGDFILDTARSMEVGESLGVKYFQRVIITDPVTGERTLSPLEYLIIDMPVRRQSQHLIKKQSIPDNNRIIDQMSGQVTGASKGSRISLPELMALESRGLNDTLREVIKVRGGDREAYNAMSASITETGGYSLKPIENLGSRPTSTNILKALLLSIHMDNTL